MEQEQEKQKSSNMEFVQHVNRIFKSEITVQHVDHNIVSVISQYIPPLGNVRTDTTYMSL